MASAETNSVQNHMNNLRIKMVQQKIQNEKDRLRNRSASPDSTDNDFENQARLQQAMLKRQELLDKIRREQMMNDEGNRPRTYSARRRYTPSPLLVPPSRRSLPGLNHYNNFYNQYPETQRSKPGNTSPVRHVIEHKIPEPKAPQFLPPINQQQRVLQQPPPVIIQPQPQPHIMQQPGAHIIQGPPQQIIQVPGNPVVQNLGPSQPDNRGMFNKADYMEMMMMQNAQMQNMVMSQMMLNSSNHNISGVPRGSPAGVHHHHYTAPPSQPPIHHYSTVPSFDMRGNYPLQGDNDISVPTIERRPMNMLPPPRQISQPVIHQPPHPPKKTNHSNRPSSMFLFGIILKEIVAALHRIYLNPSGNIYPVLCDVIGPNCYDLSQLVHGGQMGEREESVLIQELQYVIENLIYHITEIMPSTGVLGTHRKSAVFELIRSGKRFPDGYFWQVEMERLQFGDGGRTMNVGDTEGFLLLLGIFISRSLVTTVLMKPIDYGLSSQSLSEIAERNLRIVASTLLFLVRRIAVSRQRGIMEIPQEIAKYLYDDEEMKHVYSRLSRTFNYSEGLLREWGTEYIRRLRASSLQNS